MKLFQGILIDGMILGGAASITYGVSLFGIAYGYMVGGAFALFFGILKSRSGK